MLISDKHNLANLVHGTQVQRRRIFESRDRPGCHELHADWTKNYTGEKRLGEKTFCYVKIVCTSVGLQYLKFKLFKYSLPDLYCKHFL